MKRSRRFGKEPSFLKIILVSVMLHILFISFVAVPIKSKGRDYKIYSVKLVSPIKTRIKKTIKQPRRPAVRKYKKKVVPKKTETTVEKQPVPEVKPEPKPVISLEEVEMVAKEIERLEAISQLTKKIEQEKREEKAAEIQKIQIGSKKIPEVPEPVEITGTEDEGLGEDDGLVSYYSLIEQTIEQGWVYPGRNISGLEAIISITINKDGEIIIQEIKKSSGDVLYDRSAIKAITNASPLPPPPEGFDTDIELLF
jgi:colicin import membrane protein